MVTWSSSDGSVATISTAAGSNGVASGISPGTTQISAQLARSCQLTTSIASNFNGTPINSGQLHLVQRRNSSPSGLGSTPVEIHFAQQTITSANFNLNVPDADVTFDPNATLLPRRSAAGLATTVPVARLAGNTFFSALGYLVPANLPGGIHNVTWSGTISTDSPGVSAVAMGGSRLRQLQTLTTTFWG